MILGVHQTHKADAAPVKVRISVFAKSVVVRSAAGLVPNSPEAAASYAAKLAAASKGHGGGGGGGFRWPAKWKCCKIEAQVEPNQEQVLGTFAFSGVQGEIGPIECEVLASGMGSAASAMGGGGAMARWLGKTAAQLPSTSASNMFSGISVTESTAKTLSAYGPESVGSGVLASEDADLDAALRLSLQPGGLQQNYQPAQHRSDDAELEAALALSMGDGVAKDTGGGGGGGGRSHGPGGGGGAAATSTDSSLAAAIAASIMEAKQQQKKKDMEDSEFEEALALSLRKQPGGTRDVILIDNDDDEDGGGGGVDNSGGGGSGGGSGRSTSTTSAAAIAGQLNAEDLRRKRLAFFKPP